MIRVITMLLNASLFSILVLSCEKKPESVDGSAKPLKSRERIESESPADRPGYSTGDPATDYDPEEDYKNTPGLAMDRSPELQKVLMAMPPDWLTIGENVKATFQKGKSDDLDWVITSRTSYVGETSRKITVNRNDLIVPQPPKSGWLRAMVSPNENRIILFPRDHLDGVQLFNIVEGQIVEDSSQSIPIINYDDSRRWTIGWDRFLSDSIIVGIMGEEDFSGHINVRSSIYTYDIENKILRRVDIPDSLKETFNQGISIQAASESSILVSSNDGDYTITIK